MHEGHPCLSLSLLRTCYRMPSFDPLCAFTYPTLIYIVTRFML